MRTTPASGGEKMRKMVMQRARDGGGMRGAVRRCATGGPILSASDIFTPSFAEGGVLSRAVAAIKGRKDLLDGAGDEKKAPSPPPVEKEETSDEMMKRMMKEVGEIRRKGPVAQYAKGGRMGTAVKKLWDAREGGPVPQGEEEGIDQVPALTSVGIVKLDAPSENEDENEYALTPEMVQALGGVEKLELLRAALADMRGESLRKRGGEGEDGLPGYAKAGPIDGDTARDKELVAGDASWQVPLRPFREAAAAGAVPELNAENVKDYLAPLRAEAQQHEKDIQAEGGIGEVAKRVMAGHQADAQRSVLAKAVEVQAQVNAANARPHSGFSLRMPNVTLPEIQQPGITGEQSIALQNAQQEKDWAPEDRQVKMDEMRAAIEEKRAQVAKAQREADWAPEDRQMKMSEMQAAIEEKKAQAAKAQKEADWGFSTEETVDQDKGITTKRTIPTSIESMRRKEAEEAAKATKAAPTPYDSVPDLTSTITQLRAAGFSNPSVRAKALALVTHLEKTGRSAQAAALKAELAAAGD